MRRWLVGMAALTAVSVACGAPNEEDLGNGESAATEAEISSLFDVNDLSILFPLNGGQLTPNIATSESDIWRDEDFKEVMKVADQLQLKGIDITSMKDWRVVSMRFDPCAPGLDVVQNKKSPFGDCLIEMRLIAQPVTSSGPIDTAAHLVFDLGETVPINELAANATLKDLIGDLETIRNLSATAGKPLGIHPGLKDNPGKVASKVKDFILKGVKLAKTRRIAFMGLKNAGAEPWTFFAGTVEGGLWKQSPQLPAHGKPSQDLDFLNFTENNGAVNPPNPGAVSTSALFTVKKPSQADIAKAFDVENVTKANFFTTDCVSCHSSSSRLANLEVFASPNDSRGKPVGQTEGDLANWTPPPKHITGYVAKSAQQDSTWNVRNFGYFGRKETVSGRALTETVEIVKWLNTNLEEQKKANLDGPGRSCPNPQKTWACLRAGNETCLSECKFPTPDKVQEDPKAPPTPEVSPANTDKDPCNPNIAHPNATVDVETEGGTKFVTLKGDNFHCFQRVTGGFFVSPDFSNFNFGFNCNAATEECSVKIGVSELKGDEAERFQRFFVAPNRKYMSHNGGKLTIECPSSTLCKFAVN